MAEVTGRGGALVRLAVLAALLLGGALAAAFTPLGDYLSREGVGEAISWLRASRSAPLLYVVLYAVATALAIPGSVLTLAGGAMFGLVWGTVYTTIGANIGANLAFGVGRLLGRDGVERLAGDRLDALDRATANYGFQGLLTLRLIPAVPFNALNFGSGLTSIGWSTYALATAVGIFPGTVVYTMFADALLAGSQEASREALLRVLLAGVLLVLLTFLPAIARRLGIRVPGGSTGVLALAGSLTVAQALASPAPAASQQLPDHGAFTAVLAQVVRDGGVDYAELVRRRALLDDYLSSLAAVLPTTLEDADGDSRLAFWINAYNACMLRRVADHYPIRKGGGLMARIRNSIAGRPENSVWQIPDVFTAPHCVVAGAERSQDEIEHEIIRPMGEPRIHFAVNCAARSCPVLWPEAYRGETLDAQLDRAVRHLVDDDDHFQVDESAVRLNKVLDWFRDDFGGTEGLRTFFVPYVSPATAALLADESTRIEFFEYDWTLNDAGR
jgi:uncharacterized membrane protein YdjX (TVP38/TMEM64 family)